VRPATTTNRFSRTAPSIESLGPLVTLAPRATVEYTETWDMVSGVGNYVHPSEIDMVVLPQVPPK
jgi:hypothetical protein